MAKEGRKPAAKRENAKKAAARSQTRVSGDEVIFEAAWLYYHDDLNQSEIADRLGVSRATVVNYLQEARERGIIRVHLAEDPFLRHRLAVELVEKLGRYGLKAAFIVPSEKSMRDEEVLIRVAKGAATWLPKLLQPGDTLGIAWGRTVYEVAEALEPTPIDDMRVVQLVGSMSSPYGFSVEICSAHLAQRLGARCVNLHAPAILSNAKLAEALRNEPIIHAQIEALSHCNKAIFAAGSCTPQSHIVGSGIASRADLDTYIKAGAHGVLCGRFIDANGKQIQGTLDSRMIGVTLDRLTDLDMGLLVSSGGDKVEPMRAVIRGGYASHVVTDVITAEAMLKGL